MLSRSPDPHVQLLTASELAARLRCSLRHIRRLVDGGRMPAPVRIGRLLRWDRIAIERWLAAGCPAHRAGGGK